MEVVASAKWVRATPRKVRLVADSVVGMPVSDALVVLKHMPRAAATDVWKVINSAAANAEHNYKLDASTLRIARIDVEQGRVNKRARAGSRSHVMHITKRTSHLHAYVTDDGAAPAKRAAAATPATKGKSAAKPAAKSAAPKTTTKPAAKAAPASATAKKAPAAKPAVKPVVKAAEAETVVEPKADAAASEAETE